MNKLLYLAGAIFVLLFLYQNVCAQDLDTTKQTSEKNRDTIQLEKMTITARGYKKSVTNTPGGVSIITAPEIDGRQAFSITNLLEQTPGVTKSSDSPWGSEISIRGLGRDRVIFLVDGVRVNTAAVLNARMGTVDPALVEQIEILKGPISSVYGSGSFGGVVNVITKRGHFADKASWDGKSSIDYESNPVGVNLCGYVAYNSPKFYFSLGLAGRDHNNFEVGENEGETEYNLTEYEVKNSQFSDAEGKLNAGVKLNETNAFELLVDYYHGHNIGLPGGTGNMPGTPSGQPFITYPVCSRLLVDLAHVVKPKESVWKESVFRLNFLRFFRDVNFENFPAAMPLDSIYAYVKHPTFSLRWNNILTPGNHTIVTGLDGWLRTNSPNRETWYKEGLSGPLMPFSGAYKKDAPFPEVLFITAGIFAEDDWQPVDQFTLNVGARVDAIRARNEEDSLWDESTAKHPVSGISLPPNKLIWEADTSNEVSWDAHIGATFQFHPKFNTTLLFSRGYRAASMEERYKYVNLGVKEQWGNPELKPEQSIFSEIGIHFVDKIFFNSFSFYHNYLKDLIESRAHPELNTPNEKLTNVGEARIFGLEYEFGLAPLDWLTFEGNISYTNGRDISNDDSVKTVSSVPALNGFFTINFAELYGFWAEFDFIFNADQNDTPDGIDPIKRWQRFDGRFGYTFETKAVEHTLYVGLKNISDALYRDYLTSSRGYTLFETGRSFMAGYSLNF